MKVLFNENDKKGMFQLSDSMTLQKLKLEKKRNTLILLISTLKFKDICCQLIPLMHI